MNTKKRMNMQAIPRRSFKVDIDGKEFTVKELSVAYRKRAIDEGTDDSYLAILDAVEGFTEDDFERFGTETEIKLYEMIVDFTFKPAMTTKEEKEVAEAFSMSFEEFASLQREAKLALRNIYHSRKETTKEEVEARKKPSPGGSRH